MHLNSYMKILRFKIKWDGNCVIVENDITLHHVLCGTVLKLVGEFINMEVSATCCKV